MNINKYKFWNPQSRSFITQYKYKGLVDELFEEDNILKPVQFIGISDRSMTEIYEYDVVEFVDKGKTKKGVVHYFDDYCAFCLDCDDGPHPIMHLNIEEFQVLGNIMNDFTYNENGELVEKNA